ncbi:hypothetical protein HZU38_23205 [Mycolicibacterium vanbaalenii]|jgi:hypothetical protein|uniref:hypothetical protein n=1 Tax=Mycolicibacterium vanbaalenii TaxID=110539 RepID=UPI001F19B33E|nr:hypothetical protein [Mycolicibacterium vanbaalenii]UJL27769.1 hypothetical protein HZU38_23205 [Mycolicibacterium vanbaalenii]WND54454.1 hypothetical protein QQA43_16820 [Mycolicibacterium vanbaalenii]
MVPGKRRRTAAAAAAAALMAAVLAPPVASAQPADPATTDAAAAPPETQILHNVIYRARADGTSRGAVVAYKMDDANVNSAQPTLLPGQTFEINAVLADPTLAGMELSIEWPYGSNLHCEILVDDQVVAKADQFIAPRLFRPKDDPLYGVLQCGAPLNLPIDGVSPSSTPTETPAPPTDEAPPQG